MSYLNKVFFLRKKRIPKIIHYVWVGENKIPQNTIKEFIGSWKEKNPDYELKLWNEDNIDFENEYIKNAYKNKKWANVSNLVRLMAVYKYGGFYLDTDIKVIKPLEPLRVNKCFFGFQLIEHPTDWVNNAVFGAIPGHWFIGKVLKHLESNFNGIESANHSAPKIITTLLKNEGLKIYSEDVIRVKDISIYPTRFFYPFSWEEKFIKSMIKKDTYTIHFWEKKWE